MYWNVTRPFDALSSSTCRRCILSTKLLESDTYWILQLRQLWTAPNEKIHGDVPRQSIIPMDLIEMVTSLYRNNLVEDSVSVSNRRRLVSNAKCIVDGTAYSGIKLLFQQQWQGIKLLKALSWFGSISAAAAYPDFGCPSRPYIFAMAAYGARQETEWAQK